MPKPRWFRTTRRQREDIRETGNALTVGYTLVISILIGFFLGHLVDRKFGTEPWGALVGLGLGIGAGFYNLFEFALRLSREDGDGKDPKDEP